MEFLEILNEYNIEIAPDDHHHARPNWLNFDCPYCGKDTHKYHMGYCVTGRFLNCWACGQHSVANVLMELTGLPYRKVKELAEELPTQEWVRPKRGKLVLPKGLGRLLPAHKRYLKGRNYDYRVLQKLWGIQGIGIAARLSWRIFIPIVVNGEVVSWTTRTVIDGSVRYLSAEPHEESMGKGEVLYGEDYCRGTIIVHEGPTDVWRTGPGAVATMTTSYSVTQVRLISKYPRRVICFDSEPNAQRRARQLCSALEVFPGDTYNVVLTGKDASSTDPEEIAELRSRFLES